MPVVTATTPMDWRAIHLPLVLAAREFQSADRPVPPQLVPTSPGMHLTDPDDYPVGSAGLARDGADRHLPAGLVCPTLPGMLQCWLQSYSCPHLPGHSSPLLI